LTDIDEYTTLSFPMTFNPEKDTRFVALLQYPGAVLLTRRVDTEKHVQEIVNKIFDAWPIMCVYFILTLLAAVLVWGMVSYDQMYIQYLWLTRAFQ